MCLLTARNKLDVLERDARYKFNADVYLTMSSKVNNLRLLAVKEQSDHGWLDAFAPGALV